MAGSNNSSNNMSSFGVTRWACLLTFVALSGATYLYLDAATVQSFLIMIQNDPWGTVHVYLLFYIASVVLLFPCMILQVISGALYGFWVGMLVSWLATSIGQALAFLLGRYLFRQPVKNYLHQTWPTFPAIDAAIKKEGWKLVCLLRLSPVLPYNVLNYALAITPVSFWVFSAGSSVATIPWTSLYVYLGTFSSNLRELAQGKFSYGAEFSWLSSALSMVFMMGTTVYGYYVSHRAITAVLKDSADKTDPSEQAALLGSGGQAAQDLLNGGGGVVLVGGKPHIMNGGERSGAGLSSASMKDLRDVEGG